MDQDHSDQFELREQVVRRLFLFSIFNRICNETFLIVSSHFKPLFFLLARHACMISGLPTTSITHKSRPTILYKSTKAHLNLRR